MTDELYRRIASCSPGRRTCVLTVLEGRFTGEKALFTDGLLQWESVNNGFCSQIPEPFSPGDSTGILQLKDCRILCEFTAREPKLVICGGGHVSIPLIRIARMTGCSVTVLEDRPRFAENARKAGADRVICGPFEEDLAKIPGDPDTFFVIVTRGHQYDRICLRLIAGKDHAYIGLMGSRRRTAKLLESLEKEGADPEVLKTVRTPIGLSIGAETPEEIAVSIMAEIIQIKNKARGRGGFTKEILTAILDEKEAGTRKVLATIVARTGSAPRETGTKMLVFQNGRSVGTIGGGRLEADISRQAFRMMDAGQRTLLLMHSDMTGQEAGEEGMVCGGTVDVLLEPLY